MYCVWPQFTAFLCRAPVAFQWSIPLRERLYICIAPPIRRVWLNVPLTLCLALIGPGTCQSQCSCRAGTSPQSGYEGSVSLFFHPRTGVQQKRLSQLMNRDSSGHARLLAMWNLSEWHWHVLVMLRTLPYLFTYGQAVKHDILSIYFSPPSQKFLFKINFFLFFSAVFLCHWLRLSMFPTS